jgi:hypothetical protein
MKLNFNIKKIIKMFLSLILCLFLIIGVFMMIGYSMDDDDHCLDTGYCKEGVVVNAGFGEIKINKENCLENNWEWREEQKACILD